MRGCLKSLRVFEHGIRQGSFLLTPEVLNGGEIADYVWSGVMKGKWKREVWSSSASTGSSLTSSGEAFIMKGVY